jgi:DNA primase
VREEYQRELRQRLKDFQWQAVRTSGRQGASGRSGPGGEADWRSRDRAIGQRKPQLPAASQASRSALARSPLVVGLSQDVTRQALMLKTLMSHPWLLDEVSEEVAAMRLSAPALRQLRDGLLRVHAEAAPLDTAGLKSHLLQSGLEDCVGFVQRALTHNSDRFAEPGSAEDKVLLAWRELLSLQHKFEDLRQDLAAAETDLVRDGSDRALVALTGLRETQNTTETSVPEPAGPGRRTA